MTQVTTQNGWVETTLGKAADIVKKSWKVGDEKSKYIGLEHINEGDLTLNGFGWSDDLGSNKFRFKSGDILFGKLRPYFRKVVKPDFDGICSTDIWVVRAKETFDQGFLFYFFANPLLIDKSMGASTGTRMPRADWNFLENTLWDFPSILEQRAIAVVLSSLDDKIELLREQNKTLEDVAGRLFQEWFGGYGIDDELPAGWKVGKVADIVEIFDSQRIPLSSREREQRKGYFPYHGATSIMDYVDDFLFDGIYLLLAEDGSVMDVYGYPVLQYVWGKFWVNNHAHILQGKNGFSTEMVYLLFRKTKIAGIVNGAVQLKINQGNLLNLEIILPEKGMLEKFSKITAPIFEKIRSNHDQAKTISVLRDALLPRLMLGDVRVKTF